MVREVAYRACDICWCLDVDIKCVEGAADLLHTKGSSIRLLIHKRSVLGCAVLLCILLQYKSYYKSHM